MATNRLFSNYWRWTTSPRAFTLADNPVYQMELRQIIRARAFQLAMVIILAGCASALIDVHRPPQAGHLTQQFTAVPANLPAILYLLPLFAAVAAATMAVRDHDHARADFLRLTDLTLTDIVEGRFFAALTPMLLILVAAIPFIVARLFIPPLSTMLALLLLLSGSIACGAACGLNAGAANREYAVALLVAVLVTTCLTPFCYLLPLLITALIIIPSRLNLTHGDLLFHTGAGIGAWMLALLLVSNAELRLKRLFTQVARDGR